MAHAGSAQPRERSRPARLLALALALLASKAGAGFVVTESSVCGGVKGGAAPGCNTGNAKGDLNYVFMGDTTEQICAQKVPISKSICTTFAQHLIVQN